MDIRRPPSQISLTLGNIFQPKAILEKNSDLEMLILLCPFLGNCKMFMKRLKLFRRPPGANTRGRVQELQNLSVCLPDALKYLTKAQFNCSHHGSPLGGTKMMPLFS